MRTKPPVESGLAGRSWPRIYADLKMDEKQQAYLWQPEDHGNLLSRH